MPRTPPGQTRERVFEYVKTRLAEGQPPTIREVQAALGFRAVETAREHLLALVQEGRLRQDSNKARGFRLPGAAGLGSQLVPILGRVQAGVLTTAVEDVQGYVAVQSRAAASALFALRVRGESMRDAGILPGDLVLVRRQDHAESGDIVVAMVGDEATVKRLQIRKDGVALMPANPDFEPLLVAPQALVMLGKVIEVRRYLEAEAPRGLGGSGHGGSG